jgi:hypothetical protein
MRSPSFKSLVLLRDHWTPVACTALFFAAAIPLAAQPTSAPPRDPLISLMTSSPKIEIPAVATATAAFDPPVVRPGDRTFLRVMLTALEESIEWPAKPAAPPQLDILAGAHEQTLQYISNSMQPRAAINYRVRGSSAGVFTVPAFAVKVDGKPVTVPAAQLEVKSDLPEAVMPSAQLTLGLPGTNLYVGQAIQAQLVLQSAPGMLVQGVMQPQLSGEGLLVDLAATRQHVEMAPRVGGNVPTFVCDITFTPMIAGKLDLFAQGFALRYHLPVQIQTVTNGQTRPPPPPPEYMLVESDPLELSVRPLPRDGELPGFTGAIGNLAVGPPKLATNALRVGDPVRLTVTVTNSGEGPLGRLVNPPAPQSPEWQAFVANDFAPAQPLPPQQPVTPPRAGLPAQPSSFPGVTTFNYILVPLTKAARATPPIPFSYFDPKAGRYVDLTIPSVPVTVEPGVVPGDLASLLPSKPAGTEPEKEPALSGLALSRGRTAFSLVPPQQQAWFPLVQLAPGVVFLGLWRWDRRRRYLEKHPEIILRRRARRALHRQRRILRRAARAADARRFAAAAVDAMRAACAPHYPAEPRALVGRDVLPLLPETERSGRAGEVVQRFFALTDAARFGATASPNVGELLPLQAELERVLQRLEEQL